MNMNMARLNMGSEDAYKGLILAHEQLRNRDYLISGLRKELAHESSRAMALEKQICNLVISERDLKNKLKQSLEAEDIARKTNEFLEELLRNERKKHGIEVPDLHSGLNNSSEFKRIVELETSSDQADANVEEEILKKKQEFTPRKINNDLTLLAESPNIHSRNNYEDKTLQYETSIIGSPEFEIPTKSLNLRKIARDMKASMNNKPSKKSNSSRTIMDLAITHVVDSNPRMATPSRSEPSFSHKRTNRRPLTNKEAIQEAKSLKNFLFGSKETRTISRPVQEKKPKKSTSLRLREHKINCKDGEGIGIQLGKQRDQAGAVVTDVLPKGPAARAGIKKGHLVATISGVDVLFHSLASITQLIEASEGKLSFGIVRAESLNALRKLENKTPDDEKENKQGNSVRRALALEASPSTKKHDTPKKKGRTVKELLIDPDDSLEDIHWRNDLHTSPPMALIREYAAKDAEFHAMISEEYDSEGFV
eukprot:m.341341 g.341341  ORF g.341341 m.341341 type:complete len:480 (-) comp20039_c0_seq1:204-1643(-)